VTRVLPQMRNEVHHTTPSGRTRLPHIARSSITGSRQVADASLGLGLTARRHGVLMLIRRCELTDRKYLERRVFGCNGPDLVVA
jgi:hypothetical protein